MIGHRLVVKAGDYAVGHEPLNFLESGSVAAGHYAGTVGHLNPPAQIKLRRVKGLGIDRNEVAGLLR